MASKNQNLEYAAALLGANIADNVRRKVNSKEIEGTEDALIQSLKDHYDRVISILIMSSAQHVIAKTYDQKFMEKLVGYKFEFTKEELEHLTEVLNRLRNK